MEWNTKYKNLVALADALSTATQEIFHEKGYPDVKVSLAFQEDGDMKWEVDPQKGKAITQEIADEVLAEAAKRVG